MEYNGKKRKAMIFEDKIIIYDIGKYKKDTYNDLHNISNKYSLSYKSFSIDSFTIFDKKCPIEIIKGKIKKFRNDKNENPQFKTYEHH